MDTEGTGQRLASALIERYGVARAAVRLVFAPYRICRSVADIDHQLGPVTAMAIDRGVFLAYARRKPAKFV